MDHTLKEMEYEEYNPMIDETPTDLQLRNKLNLEKANLCYHENMMNYVKEKIKLIEQEVSVREKKRSKWIMNYMKN